MRKNSGLTDPQLSVVLVDGDHANVPSSRSALVLCESADDGSNNFAVCIVVRLEEKQGDIILKEHLQSRSLTMKQSWGQL